MDASKMIVNSKALLSKIAHLEKQDFIGMKISGDKETNSLMLQSVKILDCEMSSSFYCILYKDKALKLIAHLKLLSEQPLVITFDHSDVFNIFIRQFYI